MKITLLTAVLLFAASYSNGQCDQKAITLSSDNVNLEAGTIHEHSASLTKVKLPATGTNKTWDYSGLSGGSAITYGYTKNKSKVYSKDAVIDTGVMFLFDSDPADNYPGSIVYDEDNNGLFMAGHSMPLIWKPQPGAPAGDGILIPKQDNLPSSRVNVIKFPATNNSSWHSNYSQTLNWTLTFQELGWNNIKCTEVSYTSLTDKVVGYGDVKIPAAKKNANDDFDALMVKHTAYTTDSLFVGVVATDYYIEELFGSYGINGWALGYPTTQRMVDEYANLYGSDFVNTIIAAFGSAIDPYGLFESNGVSQGMVTQNDNSEIFYTTDAFRPAITFEFGADNTFSTLAGIVYNVDLTSNNCDDKGNVQAVVPFLNGTSNANESAAGINAGSNNTAQLSVYPNPLANSNTLNCSIVKNSDATWMLNIMNMTGQIVESIPVTARGNLNIPVHINGNQKTGLYLLNAIDENGKPVGTTKLNIIGSSF